MKKEKITLAHGSGGRQMHKLIDKLRARFSNKILDELTDSAEFKIAGTRLAFTTDSYVVKPLFFPGGDIGKLAVCGTVNDISMKGAKPLFISLAFIIEEGLEYDIFEKITGSIRDASRIAGVKVVTGDIKVVEKGKADRLYINTSGIGVIDYKGAHIGAKAMPGDVIIINGSIAEHGIAVLSAREGLGFSPPVRSDCKNLNFDVARCLVASKKISVMRDLTRGGLATALNEIAASSRLGIEIWEKAIPIKARIRKVCDILGFDPLYIANEGKFISFVHGANAAKVKKAIGKGAKVIGEVTKKHKKEVYLKTRIGSNRILPMLESDQLPRIC